MFGQRHTRRAQQLHTVPQSAMREQVIILALVPGAVVQQSVREQIEQAVLARESRMKGFVVAQYSRGGQNGNLVPHLPI